MLGLRLLMARAQQECMAHAADRYHARQQQADEERVQQACIGICAITCTFPGAVAMFKS